MCKIAFHRLFFLQDLSEPSLYILLKSKQKTPQIQDLQGFPVLSLRQLSYEAETVGFEPTCRDEPTNAFRVRRVTASSLHLQSVPLAFQRHLLYYTKFFPVCHLVLQLFCLFLLSSLLSGAEKLIKAVGNSQSDSVLVLLLR